MKLILNSLNKNTTVQTIHNVKHLSRVWTAYNEVPYCKLNKNTATYVVLNKTNMDQLGAQKWVCPK